MLSFRCQVSLSRFFTQQLLRCPEFCVFAERAMCVAADQPVAFICISPSHDLPAASSKSRKCPTAGIPISVSGRTAQSRRRSPARPRRPRCWPNLDSTAPASGCSLCIAAPSRGGIAMPSPMFLPNASRIARMASFIGPSATKRSPSPCARTWPPRTSSE